jgi:predicted aspartyl protease
MKKQLASARWFLTSAICLLPFAFVLSASAPDHAAVPLLVEGNRPYIDVTFHRPNGSVRTARFLIDSGGGGFLIAEPLAKDLGLKLGEVSHEEGQDFAVVTNPPAAFVGDFQLPLEPARVSAVLHVDSILPKAAPGHAEGMLPAHVLAKGVAVFDYPRATFTIAKAGALAPKGTALPMPVSKKMGFARTEIQVDGKTYGFLIDTGASFTMVSEVLLKSWGSAHANWPRHQGAFGDAATLGGTTLETMFVPAGRWGTNNLGEFGVTSQKEGTFEKYMTQMMTAPIVGSLAGNVLKHFRVEMDFAAQKLYLSKP